MIYVARALSLGAPGIPPEDELASEHAPCNREKEPNVIRHNRKHTPKSQPDLTTAKCHSQRIRNDRPRELQDRTNAIPFSIPHLIRCPERLRRQARRDFVT